MSIKAGFVILNERRMIQTAFRLNEDITYPHASQAVMILLCHFDL